MVNITDQTVIGIKPPNSICGGRKILSLLLPLNLSMGKLITDN